MMLAILLTGLGPGWYVARSRHHAETAEAIRALGGKVVYDWEYRDGEFADFPRKSPWPAWMTKSIGPDYFAQITHVRLQNPLETLDEDMRTRLRELRRLEWIYNGSESETTDDALAIFGQLDQLRQLTIDGNAATHEGLAHLRSMTRLEGLLAETLVVDDADLANLIGLTSLTWLRLRADRVTDAGFFRLKGMTQLKTLEIRNLDESRSFDGWDRQYENSGLTSVGLGALADMNRLDQLVLSRLKIRSLGPITHLTSIRSLDLDHSAVDGRGLATLPRMVGLETLKLEGTEITDEGLGYVAKLPNLRSLFLSFTRITDAGLAEVAKLSDLDLLDLSSTRITDAGLVHVARLAKLGYLDLRFTEITDAGLVYLDRMTRCRRIILSPGRVTRGAIDALRAKLPGAEID